MSNDKQFTTRVKGGILYLDINDVNVMHFDFTHLSEQTIAEEAVIEALRAVGYEYKGN